MPAGIQQISPGNRKNLIIRIPEKLLRPNLYRTISF